MKRIVHFSKAFFPAAIISAVLIILGIIGYVILGGFNLGVDFQAGLIQEVQFAPTAFSLTYTGLGNASVSMDRSGLYIVISGSGVEGTTHSFPYADYGTIGVLLGGIRGKNVEGLGVAEEPSLGNIPSLTLIQSAQGNPQLSSIPYVVHYLPPNAPFIGIDEVRTALLSLGTVSVQVLGESRERRFMIRMEDSEVNNKEGVPAEKIISALEANFGSAGWRLPGPIMWAPGFPNS